ncbi:hypothetical protein Pcinc_028231 [Petrolisthes cinctipes]|uniref:Uncharacterized protein n=1 Tax=Petrolisthes cinctipes TaxID=88211 RepID=A0AAE1F411_PETCI|nr:hypothetical protein Pcinc_028231 [Petrolisthes cinctipes]
MLTENEGLHRRRRRKDESATNLYYIKNLPHHSHNKQQGKDRLMHFIITCQREGQTDTTSPVRGKDRLIHFITTCQREGQTDTLHHHLSEGRTD